jgi:hypothetical protein
MRVDIIQGIPKDAPRWLYEALHSLALNQQSAGLGLQAIIRGESPDGSGEPLFDDGLYFKLGGRSGGQTAHGAIETAGSLTLVSTAATSRGKIYLGQAQTSAYDESVDSLGIGTASPTAMFEVQQSTRAYARPISLQSGVGLWTNSAGNNVDLWLYIDDTIANDADYIQQNGIGGAIRFNMTGMTAPAAGATHVLRIRVKFIDLSGGADPTFNYTLLSGGATVIGSTGNVIPASFTTITRVLTPAEVALIGTYADLDVQLSSTGVGGSGDFQVSWIEFEISGVTGRDLTRWSDPNLGTLNKVSSDGKMTLGSTTVGNTIIKLLIQGTVSQSVDLVQVKNNSGTSLIVIDSVGKLTLSVGFQLTPGASNGFILRSDASGNGTWASAAALATRTLYRWAANGPYQPGTEVDGAWIAPTAFTITAVWLYRTTAGTSGSTVLDLNKNGATLFTSKPTIAFDDGDKKVGPLVPDVSTAVAAGDVLTIDIDSIESGNPADIVLVLEGA